MIPGSTNQLLAAGVGYQISRSVRLRSSATAYFNRTPASAGNRRTFTWSGWVKRGTLGAGVIFASDNNAGANHSSFFFNSGSNQLQFNSIVSGANNIIAATNAVFRDPSAWYHIVFAVDTTQATNSDGIKIYVNGVQQTLTFTVYTQNANTSYNNTVQHRLGTLISGAEPTDGYLTEINFIDGQALTPASFGETNPVTGVWKPKKYVGTYGTNGFYLNFSDPSAATAAAIGADRSGNGNNWTPNNISVTAGVTYDSMLDVPTPWPDGGNGRGNYCVINPLQAAANSTFSNANLTWANANTASARSAFGTIAVSSGKWYWEVTPTTVSSTYYPAPGVNTAPGSSPDSQSGDLSTGYHYMANGQKYNASVLASYGASFSVGDVIGVALDMDAGTLSFSKNGVSQGTAYSGITGTVIPAFIAFQNAAMHANFGQRPFAYTPPSGFRALNTQNLPTPTIAKGNQYFDATTFTANGGVQTVTNSGSMQPDMVWIKDRSVVSNHTINDSVRGSSVYVYPNLTNAEATNANYLTSFNANGFSLGSANYTNGEAIVGWQWKEGATQGFDIVTYTGNGANRTIAHSLGVAPSMMIFKARNGVTNWVTYHAALAAPATTYLQLNQTAAVSGTDATMFNSTAPTSSVFSVGTNANTNNNTTTYVAYLFSEVAGFSRAFSYTGNGSADGPFVHLGFRPRFVMVKRTDAVGNWLIDDTARGSINYSGLTDPLLYANLSIAEATVSNIDILSNGFKVRHTDSDYNANGGTYIGMAFAESPFKFSLAR